MPFVVWLRAEILNLRLWLEIRLGLGCACYLALALNVNTEHKSWGAEWSILRVPRYWAATFDALCQSFFFFTTYIQSINSSRIRGIFHSRHHKFGTNLNLLIRSLTKGKSVYSCSEGLKGETISLPSQEGQRQKNHSDGRKMGFWKVFF